MFTMHKSENGDNSAKIFLRKDNNVICIMYPNSMPDIAIPAQAVLQIFC